MVISSIIQEGKDKDRVVSNVMKVDFVLALEARLDWKTTFLHVFKILLILRQQ